MMLPLHHLASPVGACEEEIPRLREPVLLRDHLVEVAAEKVVDDRVDEHERHRLDHAIALDRHEERTKCQPCRLSFKRRDALDPERESDGGIEGKSDHEASRRVGGD